MIKTISYELQVPKSLVEIVSQALNSPANKMSVETAKSEIVRVINQICLSYGVEKVQPEALTAITRAFLRNFGYMAPKEIIIAYEEYFSNPETMRNRGDLYNNSLNAANFQTVLGLYAKKRQVIAQRIKAEQTQESLELIEQAKSQKAQLFSKTLIANIVEARAKIETWSSVPLFWYEALDSRGWLPYKQSLVFECWAKSEDLAKVEMKKEDINQIRKLVKRSELESTTHSKRQNIARKLYLFEMIVNNADWPKLLTNEQ